MLSDRTQAARLLGNKLMNYKNSDAIVVAIPHGGVPVGYQLAEMLHLPLEVIPCKKIKHPGWAGKTIGSVSIGEVVLHEECSDIPQDYIYHQVAQLRSSLSSQYQLYHGDKPQQSLTGKVVILTDDVLTTADTMLACLRGIRRQQPKKIIVAVPAAATEAARTVAEEADELIFITESHSSLRKGNEFYENFPRVKDDEVKELFAKAAKMTSTSLN